MSDKLYDILLNYRKYSDDIGLLYQKQTINRNSLHFTVISLFFNKRLGHNLSTVMIKTPKTFEISQVCHN